MARPMKKVIQETKEVIQISDEIIQEVVEISTTKESFSQSQILALQMLTSKLEDRVAILEKICIKSVGVSINKVEKFNDEVPSTIESYNGMRMDASDRIQSMQNAIKILPPNMVVDGRHLKENIEAICGFKVLDEMMDEAYDDVRGN